MVSLVCPPDSLIIYHSNTEPALLNKDSECAKEQSKVPVTMYFQVHLYLKFTGRK